MKEQTVKHATIVVERTFKASPDQVFAAWADPAAHGQWNVPGEDWVMAQAENDFRVGGRQMSRFGPKGDPRHWSEGRYLEIEDRVRIISAGTMHDGEKRATATLCTVEFIPSGSGTHLILTDQSAFFGEEAASDRKTGWGQILDRLEAQMDGKAAKANRSQAR